MGADFGLFGLLIVVSVIVWVLFIKISDFISPKTKAVGKGNAPIESAERTIGSMRNVGFQYFFYALIFVIFEAIFVFIFLWAESARSLSAYISIPVLISLVFMVILVRYMIRIEKSIQGG